MFDIIFISMLWKESQGTILDVADFGTVQNYCKKFFIQIPFSDLKIIDCSLQRVQSLCQMLVTMCSSVLLSKCPSDLGIYTPEN